VVSFLAALLRVDAERGVEAKKSHYGFSWDFGFKSQFDQAGNLFWIVVDLFG